MRAIAGMTVALLLGLAAPARAQHEGHEGLHFERGAWTFMVHGFGNAVFTHTGGIRSDEKLFGTGMAMGQASRRAGGGTLGFRAMLTLEPAMGKYGYPLLLQTGETADGRSHLVDRQHPHDLFMELATSFSRSLGSRSSLLLYAGWPGEPALGPPAFMHRASAVDNPVAPIGHHWLDSTHISYGVATLGAAAGRFKLEASVFNGREPDEKRWGLEGPRFDSWSFRGSFNPSPSLALQVSYGKLRRPDPLHPNIDVERITASASLSRRLGTGTWHTTLAFGRNERSRSLTAGNPQYPRYGPARASRALLLETAAIFGPHTAFFRAERVEKDELFPAIDPWYVRVFPVAKLSLGYVYDLRVASRLRPGLGASGSVDLLPEELDGEYGRRPVSFLVFGRLRLR